jgi:4-hydroxy-3-methylbut-2-en-1-yl diphosphate reductase
MTVILAQPRGFCTGTIRAVPVACAVEEFRAPVREIMHDADQVERRKAESARLVENLTEMPSRALSLFWAQGLSHRLVAGGADRDSLAIDAAGPLERIVPPRRSALRTGRAEHPRVAAISGHILEPVHRAASEEDVAVLKLAAEAPVAYVTQTALGFGATNPTVAARSRRIHDGAKT